MANQMVHTVAKTAPKDDQSWLINRITDGVREAQPDVYLEVQHPCWSCNSNSSSANASAGVR